MSSKRWCATLFGDDLEVEIKRVKAISQGIGYGKETCPKTGKQHYQVYFETDKKKAFEKMQKLLTPHHIEISKGTAEANEKYCSKEGQYTFEGVFMSQGKRKDLDTVRQVALTDGMRAVTARHNLQQINTAQKFLTFNEPARDFKPIVHWYWGPTGVGKSKRAREVVNMDDCFTKNTGEKWWDGYDGHEDVIIDDFRDSWWCITYMLGLLDRYEFQVEVKGGHRQMRAKTMIITSCKPPWEMYGNTGEAIEQLLRRIDLTHEMTFAEKLLEV